MVVARGRTVSQFKVAVAKMKARDLNGLFATVMRVDNINEVGDDGYAIIHHMVMYGLTDILGSFIDVAHPDVDIRSKNGTTPLMLACGVGNQRAALMLIKAGADVNAESDMMYTALHEAVRRRAPAIVSCLVTAGAILKGDLNGIKPDVLAARIGDKSICDMLHGLKADN